MATYAIGDVQGCHDELLRLLEHLRFDPSRDRLWFAGDLVNRGPKSLEVLRLVRDLGTAAITVLGNHDLHLLAGAHDPKRIKRQDTLHAILDAPDCGELIEWLRTRPFLHHDPALGFTLIHAGLPPQWDLDTAQSCAREIETVFSGPDWGAFTEEMYGNRPDRWDPGLAGTDRLRFITNCFTRLRYCTADGRLGLEFKGAPGSQPPDYLPWFQVPGRRSRSLEILFGHWSTLGEVDDFGVHSLDTGCLWGGRLTALRIHPAPLERIHINCPGARKPGEE